jgi:DNA-binding Lrp family transcriptional regulator
MRAIYVLVKCELGKAYEVADQLVENFDRPPQVHSISGKYDLIAQFYVPGETDIGRFVNTKIHAIPGIVDTETIICFNAFTPDSGLRDSPKDRPVRPG